MLRGLSWAWARASRAGRGTIVLALLLPMAVQLRRPRTPTPCRRSLVGEQARVATLHKRLGHQTPSRQLPLLLREPPHSLRTLPVRKLPILRCNLASSRALLPGHQIANSKVLLLEHQIANSRALLLGHQTTNSKILLLGHPTTNSRAHLTTQEEGINRRHLPRLLLRHPKGVLTSGKLPLNSAVSQAERNTTFLVKTSKAGREKSLRQRLEMPLSDLYQKRPFSGRSKPGSRTDDLMGFLRTKTHPENKMPKSG